MSAQNTPDEVSLGELGGVFRRFYHFLLIRIYRIFRFILKSWYIILALVVIGGIIGYFQSKDRDYTKKAELLVQINYKGANQIYQAVDLLSGKIKEKDSSFFEEHKLLTNDHLSIKKIKIEPIVSLNNLLQNLPEYSRPFEVLIDETKTKEPLLVSEVFRNQYRIHRITLQTSSEGNQKTIQTVLDFLNDHPAFENTREIYIASLGHEIEETRFSISRIDSIFNKLGSTSSLATGKGNQIFVDSKESTVSDLHLLLQEKSKLLDRLEQLEVDQANYQEAVVLKSHAALIPEKGFFANRTIWVPFFFIMIFFGISIVWYILAKGKKLSDQSEQPSA